MCLTYYAWQVKILHGLNFGDVFRPYEMFFRVRTNDFDHRPPKFHSSDTKHHSAQLPKHRIHCGWEVVL